MTEAARRTRGRQADHVEQKWLTVRQAAAYLGCSENSVRDALNDGRIEGHRTTPTLKGQWRTTAAALDAFIESAAQAAS